MRRAGASFPLLALVVIIPLLVLSILAWAGIANMRQSAWVTARNQADSVAASMANALSRDLPGRARPIPAFDDPPLPGPTTAPDDPLNSDDKARLADLALHSVDDKPTSAGLSPAGLPRRLLAALRLLESDGGEIWANQAADIAIKEPSAMSARALEEVVEHFPAKQPALRLWQQSLHARQLAIAHPEFLKTGGWVDGYWIGTVDGTQKFLAPDEFKTGMSPVAGLPWAAVRLKADGRILSGPADGRVLAAAPITFSSGPTLEVVATDSALIESEIRQIQRWVYAVLLVAVSISLGGLLLIRRAFNRERKLNALKSDFVASVSHELRAPIASIRLMADALEQGKIQGKTAKEFHKLISKEGARLSTLIENVLDFARIEQDRKQWCFEETDLGALTRECLSVMGPLAGEKNIRLEMAEGSVESISADVDPGAIQQALVNLIDNAIKFSPAGSRIEIGLSRRDDHHLLSVADEGPGIPQTEHGKIFEKFHRLGNEMRRETPGTGIGLSLVKAIVEAHRGHVTLESDAGRGSVFTIHLPEGGPTSIQS